VHTFVSSRLGDCNSLLYGIGDGLLMKLQTVQNAAARVVTGTKKFDHITPALRQLHWLPVRQRITFKLAMITFKCLHGLAPPYLADVYIPVSSVICRLSSKLIYLAASALEVFSNWALCCCSIDVLVSATFVHSFVDFF